MGDSCFNAGMKSVTAAAGKRVGATPNLVVCVPTADNRVADTVARVPQEHGPERRRLRGEGEGPEAALSRSGSGTDPKLCGTQISVPHAIDDVVSVGSARWRSNAIGAATCRRATPNSLVIRGYIAKYNDPPVRTFLSICGCNAGVARGRSAVPPEN